MYVPKRANPINTSCNHLYWENDGRNVVNSGIIPSSASQESVVLLEYPDQVEYEQSELDMEYTQSQSLVVLIFRL